MKWAYSIKSKLRVSLLLAVVMMLVMVNNLVERRHMKSLKRDFKEIYQDRLLAEGYIFQVYDHLYKKSELFHQRNFSDGIFEYSDELIQHQEAISTLMHRYGDTYLTSEEKNHFHQLEHQIAELQSAENLIATGARTEPILEQIGSIRSLTRQCLSTLAALSGIQMAEGEVLERRSSQTFMGSISTSHFEMSLLIFIALMIQVLVISGKPVTFRQSPGLN